MKKLLASLLVLAMCAPAMAVQFGLVAGSGADAGKAIITMDTEGAVVRGVALKVTSAALDIDGAVVNPAFNCFIDYAYANTSTYAVGAGHPFALDGAAGVAADGATTYVISMGVLDELGAQAGYTGSGDLIKFAVADGQVCIAADTLRGPESGVVGDAALTSNIASVPCITITSVVPVNLVVATTYGGTVTTPGVGTFSVNQGSTQNLVAGAPIANFIFWKWTGDTSTIAAPNAASTTIVMDTAKSVTANFSLMCTHWNLTKKKGGLTDNFVNSQDLSNLINYVNANKTGTLFSIPQTNPAYSVDYNLTKMAGGTDNFVNTQDLSALINWVNSHKTGTLFSVACLTCGC